MDLCNKCYWHRDLIHESSCEGSEWEQRGPEFEEEKAPVDTTSKGEASKYGDEVSDSESSFSSDSDSDAE